MESERKYSDQLPDMKAHFKDSLKIRLIVLDSTNLRRYIRHMKRISERRIPE